MQRPRHWPDEHVPPALEALRKTVSLETFAPDSARQTRALAGRPGIQGVRAVSASSDPESCITVIPRTLFLTAVLHGAHPDARLIEAKSARPTLEFKATRAGRTALARALEEDAEGELHRVTSPAIRDRRR